MFLCRPRSSYRCRIRTQHNFPRGVIWVLTTWVRYCCPIDIYVMKYIISKNHCEYLQYLLGPRMTAQFLGNRWRSFPFTALYRFKLYCKLIVVYFCYSVWLFWKNYSTNANRQRTRVLQRSFKKSEEHDTQIKHERWYHVCKRVLTKMSFWSVYLRQRSCWSVDPKVWNAKLLRRVPLLCEHLTSWHKFFNHLLCNVEKYEADDLLLTKDANRSRPCHMA